MINISAGEFAKIVSGSLHKIDSQMIINQSPVINSKKASKDNFFVAFVGSQVDGHDYVKEAIELAQITPPFAAAVNAQFVPKTLYHQTLLNDNDKIELIVPITGG